MENEYDVWIVMRTQETWVGTTSGPIKQARQIARDAWPEMQDENVMLTPRLSDQPYETFKLLFGREPK